MPLIPVSLPPGMYLNSTPYAAKGRWAMGNRVRWHDGSLRAIGGWVRRTLVSSGAVMPSLITIGTPETETIRDLYFWDDTYGAIHGLAGSNLGLYYINGGNEARDVTPDGFLPGGNHPVTFNGYGTGLYGRQDYGRGRNAAGLRPTPVGRWVFDAWGRDALCMPVLNGPIYSFTPGDISVPTVMSANAPTDNGGFIVTDQRIVMVIDPDGALGEDRIVKWSDSENYSVWEPDDTNQAGSQILQGVGQLLSIHRILGQILILSESDVHTARYLGPPYIYGFERVGHSCGPIGRYVVATTDRFAMWLGDRQFWIFDGSLRPTACDVMDYLDDDMDEDWGSAVVAHPVAEFNELWWHYKSRAGDDVDSYVAYDYVDQTWSVGRLDRTAAIDQNPTRSPVYVDHEGYMFNHEQYAVVVPGAYAQSGPLELGQGETNMAVSYIYPDSQTEGDLIFQILGRQMPTAPDLTFGPYPYANPTPTRARGREIRLRVEGNDSHWEVGPNLRLDVAASGTGRR